MHNAMNHPGLEPEMGDIKSHQLVVYDCVRVYIYIYIELGFVGEI